MSNWKYLYIILLSILSTTINAQSDLELAGDIFTSGDINMGQFGDFEGSITRLDLLQGKNDLRFQIEGVSGNQMFIDNLGKVGIGTSSPFYQLDVFTESNSTAQFSSSSENQTNLSITNTSSNSNWSLNVSGSNSSTAGSLELYSNTLAASTFISTNTGHTAIGLFVNLPNDALDVIGDIDATGCIQTSDTGTIGGTCVSDKRYKKNIVNLNKQLDKILALRPVQFDWEKEFNDGLTGDIGFIAQEVEEVIPEMVITGENGYKKVRYDISLQMRVIKAMQEQQDVISSQDDKISKQQEQIALLQREMKELKKLILKK